MRPSHLTSILSSIVRPQIHVWRSSLGAALVIYLSILLDCHYITSTITTSNTRSEKHILNTIFSDNILLLAATQKFATNTCKSKSYTRTENTHKFLHSVKSNQITYLQYDFVPVNCSRFKIPRKPRRVKLLVCDGIILAAGLRARQ